MIRTQLKQLGIHEPSNVELRVKFINTLRSIVARRMPKNKVGSPLTSDVDVFMAEDSEIEEAILKVTK